MSRVFLICCLNMIVAFSIGCSAWHSTPPENVTDDSAGSLRDKLVRFHTDDGVKSMTVKRVDYPYVEGVAGERMGIDDLPWIRVDLRDVERIEIYEVDGRKTLKVVVVSVVIIGGLLALLTAAGSWAGL